jgi:hypothetical protein
VAKPSSPEGTTENIQHSTPNFKESFRSGTLGP